jgi:hypothetical protein
MPALSSDALSFVRYDAKARTLFASFRDRRRRNYVFDGHPRGSKAGFTELESDGSSFEARSARASG